MSTYATETEQNHSELWNKSSETNARDFPESDPVVDSTKKINLKTGGGTRTR